jgi:hypothetical protein
MFNLHLYKTTAMKRSFVLLMLVIGLAHLSTAQTDGGPRGKKPKKAKGNHSNGRTQLGFASPGSVMYSIDFSKPVGDMPVVSTEGVGQKVTSTTLMTPSGWGSKETFAFVTGGGTPIQPYGSSSNPDFLAQAGFGFGDYTKTVSVVGIVNINDVSKFDNFSYSLIASRKLGKAGSVSVGALHLFADPYKTDAAESFYVAYSQAIRNSKFNYTIGVGSGRFYDNSEYDKENGKKDHGTALFGSLSYNITNYLNVSTEWTGLNLCVSSSVRVKPKWPVLSFGVTDLTRLSGDKPSFYFGLGQALIFNKRK